VTHERQATATRAEALISPYSEYFAYTTAEKASTVLLPGDHPSHRENVVRPALAVLYRIAIGPSADRYVRRFMAFERKGGGRPGWHWPSLLFPGVWAFYRKMWLLGIVFALLPVAGALAFSMSQPMFEQADVTWVVCAIVAVWILPGILPALFADSLLYGHVRYLVSQAERSARSATDAVQSLAKRSPTSTAAALLLGGGGILAMIIVIVPSLRDAYVDLGIRTRVEQAVSAVRGLEDEIEIGWFTTRLLPRQTNHPSVRAHQGAALIDDVHVHPATGRIKLAFSANVPALDGKTILIAPTRDMDDRWQWMCVPVDIPQRWLPKKCR
jgi:AcrR family transcriptional regulator